MKDTNVKNIVAMLLLMPLLAACSSEPSNRTVVHLLETEYENETANLQVDESPQINDELLALSESATSTLDDVENVNCEMLGDEDTYSCTADIVQTMNGHTSTNQGSFEVMKVDGDWVLKL